MISPTVVSPLGSILREIEYMIEQCDRSDGDATLGFLLLISPLIERQHLSLAPHPWMALQWSTAIWHEEFFPCLLARHQSQD